MKKCTKIFRNSSSFPITLPHSWGQKQLNKIIQYFSHCPRCSIMISGDTTDFLKLFLASLLLWPHWSRLALEANIIKLLLLSSLIGTASYSCVTYIFMRKESVDCSEININHINFRAIYWFFSHKNECNAGIWRNTDFVNHLSKLIKSRSIEQISIFHVFHIFVNCDIHTKDTFHLTSLDW